MSARKKDTQTNFAKVDAYENTAADYDDLPELDDAFFAKAEVHLGGKPIGRPPLGGRPKVQLTLRLDAAAVESFKATGPGWQSRINGLLAGREDVVKLMHGYEAAAHEMRHLLGMLRDERIGLKVVAPDQAEAIQSIERQIAMTDDAALSVRKVLSEAPRITVGRD